MRLLELLAALVGGCAGAVMPGLDPGIHPLGQWMDRRVKPGDDGFGNRRPQKRKRPRRRRRGPLAISGRGRSL
ncbi:hypothetical protein EK403_18430 [Hansschlegelia zhihuaiae]|uniref:Uncharacterized protein n=1 Tax=Hansschlegelia zhihuaiae TaxID=405005 RepID=A0A4Q0M8S3_9HYPH|nr:hypothetical protein EK403_18430 [Hansschlegelia zhihuaiae]